MTSGQYFNKGVKALDSPHVGHVVRETDDKIVVFGGGDDRYDIPKSQIRFTSGNVLIDLPMYDIAKRYKISRTEPLPTGKATKDPWTIPGNVDLATYERQYPKSLFNKGVRTQDEEHVGHVMKETDNTIVIWGHYDWRFDIPKSKIIAVGRNVILGMDYQDVFQYKVDRNAPLPSGEPIDKLAEE
jgi:RNase P/RNase MRP subunit p29